ncbi:beta-N-acetylhexosaminidase [Sulfitobacter sp. M57]|uniref:beta-N-acetylhexosaminidase n=1 Tax=unclassified Sulfitobacter TaxID=196795 RepID=UPI0023E31E51|nr:MULTISPECIES: beta-N-acetylhexosaminidase [unclassified Sulfitobacter]MDF3413927.1 beta-N-acetylhexosaminidase [Sulfitobacter sp. KE5]MDF3420792.1 beta-N-acetylhexosaminidase [Sulfitobacter sp. KE43]MDF3432473.1 beta-N-acetylhexosaminidase [Sulfitobacter sp. KE42]MDF3458112.1 beta-N-acetylhexosaminidase [Sulfitobacter sp. S74]MDF3462013.1 beta-N-acetylhexosaminidase [Sulfitobacter sp. Ks18]
MPYGATIIDAEGLRLSAEEKALFRAADPFGFILFARNIDTPDQVRALCDEMREAVGREAIITIDQEGGRVQRMRAPHWREWAPPLDLVVQAGPQAARAMYLMYRLIADELRSVGIDSNCAPMVDVAGDLTHSFLRNRCYGEDPAQVTALGRVVGDAMLAGGVLPVVKHMPGHGRATMDSHFDLPTVTAAAEDLKAVDFAPFKALNHLPMGMTAHLVYEALDDRPATLSSTMMQVIREEIGFDNLIMTDDISMKALAGTPAQNAVAAIDAGCDVVLYCNASLSDRRAVTEAVGHMTPAAQTRAERALAMRTKPDTVDIPALEREFRALSGGALHG